MSKLEGNELLRKFLEIDYDINFNITTSLGISFDNDWQLLMKVVEKIESIQDDHHGYFQVHISGNSCTIQGSNLWKAIEPNSKYGWVYLSDPNAIFETKRESTWYNVIKFIQWYETDYKKDNIEGVNSN